MMHTLLLNAFMACIEVDDVTNALYFKNKLKRTSLKKMKPIFE